MSSDSELVTSIVENNYVTLMIIAAVGYDYLLTIPDEIEYIWSKPWTRVSTLFVLVRYFGLYAAIVSAIIGSSFLPGPEKTYVFTPFLSLAGPIVSTFIQCCLGSLYSETLKGYILVIFDEWAILLFIVAADLAMIFRVWAIFGRSRIILGILLMIYVPEVVFLMISCVTAVAKITAVVFQVLDFSFCVPERDSPTWVEVYDTLQVALAAMMCLLVATKFVWDSFQTYRVTKQWQASLYMKLFVREGMLYFLAILLFALIDILYLWQKLPTAGWWILLTAIQHIPVFALTPRFILSVRALHASQLRGRYGTRDIDTEFGFTSGYGPSVRETAVVFAGVGLTQSEEDELGHGEEIQMGEMEMGITGSRTSMQR